MTHGQADVGLFAFIPWEQKGNGVPNWSGIYKKQHDLIFSKGKPDKRERQLVSLFASD